MCSSNWAEVHFWDLSRFLGLLLNYLHAKSMSDKWELEPIYYFLPPVPILWGCLLCAKLSLSEDVFLEEETGTMQIDFPGFTQTP